MYKIAIFSIFMSGIAHAGTYQCGTFQLNSINGKIQLAGFLGNGSKPVVGGQTKYNPTAKYAGSTRFDISSVCQASGNVYAILDKSLSEGNASGELTIQSTCDADGGAPTFQRYFCKIR